MRITGRDGVVLELTPAAWQFPAETGPWDDRWIVIEGRVDLGERAWSFRDPALMMSEARRLARWLREAAAGRGTMISVADTVERRERGIDFTEPLLAFTVLEYRQSEAVVRGHLYAEAAPPWLGERSGARVGLDVDIVVGADQLADAADEWTRELDALSARE